MYRKVIKRIFDLFLAMILFLPSMVIVAVCSIAIKLETKGPAFFIQERPGYHGKIFKIYKLRTMRSEVFEEGKILNDSERLTKVGRYLRMFSLDELPQIWNVLRGEMSFIGPRPLFTKYLPLYTKEQMRRHDVLPGITGWAQVNGRNEISWEKKFEYDVWYVDHISFILDFKIVLMTIHNILSHSGINDTSGHLIKEFTGTRRE